MFRILRWVLFVVVSGSLASCGGGGGGDSPPPSTPDTPLVYGTAANGAALDGTVSIEDSAGHVVSLPVSSGSGQFSASVVGMQAPFMLKAVSADGKLVLYSAAAQPGRANINPLTHLGLLRIAVQAGLQTPAELFASPTLFSSRLTASALQHETARAMARLMPSFVARLPGASNQPDALPAYDPFATPFLIGDAVDRLLDAYPIAFTQAAGATVATQSESATGFASQVARSDTVAAKVSALQILGEASVASNAGVQLTAQAVFSNGVVQPVPVRWSLTGVGTVDQAGHFVAPELRAAEKATMKAEWFDGETKVVAEFVLDVMAAQRPEGLTIMGIDPAVGLEPSSEVRLQAMVSWADGSTSLQTVEWSWSGDPGAVATISPDGLLRAGAPTGAAKTATIHASFNYQGHVVGGDVVATVRPFVRRLVSARISGLADGQTFSAGDHFSLSVIGQWNDDSESSLPAASWRVDPAAGAVPRMAVTISASGELSSAPYFLSPDAGAGEREPDAFVVTARYDQGNGTSASQSISVLAKPQLKEPVSLSILGVTSLPEGASTTYQAVILYSDGSTEDKTASVNWVVQEGTSLTQVAGASFVAAAYGSKPASPQSTRVLASMSYGYTDASGTAVIKPLSATLDVAVTWVEPVLRHLAFASALDFLVPTQPARVDLSGHFQKLGREWWAPVDTADILTSDDAVVASGQTVTAGSIPASASETWVTLTARARDTASGELVEVSRTVTISLPSPGQKRLLAYPWGPANQDVQFRAISSDGHLDDYVVVRDEPLHQGFRSSATQRRAPYLSGVIDVAQTQVVGNETSYVAAVERGEVAVLRHSDLYDGARTGRPVVLDDVSDAVRVALVVKTTAPSVSRLYVLTGAGRVRQYRLPLVVNRPLVSADVVFERELAGQFSAISAGAEHVLCLGTDGHVVAEGRGTMGQVGNPAATAADWLDAVEVQASDGVGSAAVHGPLSGVTMIGAEHDASFASASGNIWGWGKVASISYLLAGISEASAEQSSEAVRVTGAARTPRAMTAGAYVAADGSVIFRTAMFVDSRTRDLWGGGPRYYTAASWLPPATQIVAGRRQITVDWPSADALALLMPIVRTETDRLVYLDGLEIVDASGNPLVLP